MNLVLKVTFDNYDEWRAEFDSHEARAEVCDESKTTVGKIDDKSCIVMPVSYTHLTLPTMWYV